MQAPGSPAEGIAPSRSASSDSSPGALLGTVAGIDLDAYWPLVEAVAREMERRSAGRCAAEELLSSGWQGLVRAAERFDPGRGFKFNTFAQIRVRGAMQDYMRQVDPLTRTSRKAGKVTVLDFSSAFGEADGELNRVPAARPDPGSAEELARELFKRLDHLDRFIARAFWLEERTQDEIGLALGVTGSAVSRSLSLIRKRLGFPEKGASRARRRMRQAIVQPAAPLPRKRTEAYRVAALRRWARVRAERAALDLCAPGA